MLAAAGRDLRVAPRDVVEIDHDVVLHIAADGELLFVEDVLLPQLGAVDLDQAALAARRDLVRPEILVTRVSWPSPPEEAIAVDLPLQAGRDDSTAVDAPTSTGDVV